MIVTTLIDQDTISGFTNVRDIPAFEGSSVLNLFLSFFFFFFFFFQKI